MSATLLVAGTLFAAVAAVAGAWSVLETRRIRAEGQHFHLDQMQAWRDTRLEEHGRHLELVAAEHQGREEEGRQRRVVALVDASRAIIRLRAVAFEESGGDRLPGPLQPTSVPSVKREVRAAAAAVVALGGPHLSALYALATDSHLFFNEISSKALDALDEITREFQIAFIWDRPAGSEARWKLNLIEDLGHTELPPPEEPQ